MYAKALRQTGDGFVALCICSCCCSCCCSCWFCSFCVAQSDLFFRFSNWLRLSLAVTIAPSWNRNRSHRHCELLTTSQQQQQQQRQRQQMKLKLKKSAHIPVQKMCNAIKSIASGLKAQLTDWDYVEQHHGGHISPPPQLPQRCRLSPESHLKRVHSPHSLYSAANSLYTSLHILYNIYVYISYIYMAVMVINSQIIHGISLTFPHSYRNWHFECCKQISVR